MYRYARENHQNGTDDAFQTVSIDPLGDRPIVSSDISTNVMNDID